MTMLVFNIPYDVQDEKRFWECLCSEIYHLLAKQKRRWKHIKQQIADISFCFLNEVAF